MKKQAKAQKTVAVLVLCIFALALATPAFAGIDNVTPLEVKGEAKKLGDTIVDALRQIAAVAAVIFVVWAGYLFWTGGGNPQKLAMAKDRVLWFLVAMLFVFGAEKIVGFIIKLLNISDKFGL
ncbi:MAG: TrbC/VirB2 family protein [Syntrophothermus sp.]|uniref:TrbC/VirB2 family protein n=1 Tax=Syntrophothermus sp. TaxID=2736299 RepID=UPI00257CA60D|nr:TrbC/VirB2 family protein [Syntrophothermus sp.]NSW82757.1 TrbC/VirB2 family protein [Syntrophothermus sp.]